MVDDKVDKVPSTSTLVDPTSSSWARPVLTNARLAVEVFDGTGHFGMWQSEVLDALFQQGLDIVVEESKPEDVEDRNWLTINWKAVAEANVTKCDEEESDFSLATSSSRNASEIWLLDSASDETPLTTHGIGSVRLQNEDGTIVTLKGVRYSPKLKKNLISIGTLESKGFKVRAKDGVMKIISGVLVKNHKHELWHMRLGHAGEKSLNLLIKQDDKRLVLEVGSREHCINREDTRVWVYTLKTKDGVLGVFIKWKKIMETQTCRKIKHLRTDNGGEYKNDLCTKFCEDEGIVSISLSTTYTTDKWGRPECPEPDLAGERKTPFEKWYGKPATDYDSLHVFGSAAYYHVKESKLDPRAKKALFIDNSGITVNAEQLDGTPKKVEFEIVPADREPDDNSPMVEGDHEEEEV
ncbi:retrovirus-related pol polyprotein from transposon TNT 1-94 [Tanacetum coccineum]|uniref:Retrovirus-related pol polyprotein from transposon TNT 1-94 n=1 Tax=Tanacetum coccineum TaxID=301880 RepID=A0ABQ5CWH7_9ASTR